MNIATYIKRDQIKTDLKVRAEAVETPVFDNSEMWFDTWKQRNRVVLEDYFIQLGVLPEEEHICTMIQYERQQAAQSEYLAPTMQEVQEELYQIGYISDEQYNDPHFSVYDGDTGIPCVGEF